MYRRTAVLLISLTSVWASPQTSTTTGVALGATCDPSIPNVCAGGAQCYATNSMLIPACGNFQAACTSDAQCAFNTCVAGLCNGFKASTTTPSTPSTTPARPTGTYLSLGAQCDPTLSNACAYGASCYASNSMLIPVCGNFQAGCTSDSQCAFNTCNNGFCNGVKPSSTSSANPKPTGTYLGLGQACDPAVANACAYGASCYATNSMLIPRCGNFQATCTSDSQCAYNKCVSGFCNGPLSSSAITPAPTPSPTTFSILPTGGQVRPTNATRTLTPTASPTFVPANGGIGRSVGGSIGGSFLVLIVAAFFL